MSGASVQDYDPDTAPLSLFRNMNPGERNATKTLCDTSISSGVCTAESLEMSDHEPKHGRLRGNTTGVANNHRNLDAEYIENNPDYMEDSASDTTDGRSTWTSTCTVDYYLERHKEPQSAEEDEVGSDANDDGGGEKREKSAEGSTASDGESSTSCDRFGSDSDVLERKDLWEECANPNE